MQHNTSSDVVQINPLASALQSFGDIITDRADKNIDPYSDDILASAEGGRRDMCVGKEPTDAQLAAAYYMQNAAMNCVNMSVPDWVRLHVLDNLDAAHVELTGIPLFIRPDTAPKPII